MAKAEVMTVDAPKPVQGEDASSLVQLAIREKVPVEMLERIVALTERVTERGARMAYFAALAAFQSEVGPVPKTAAITVERNGTTKPRSRFAPLHVIADHIREPLTRHGFMYSWDSALKDGNVSVRCTLRHVEGHSETATFEFPVKDAGAPGMNGVQVAGSARTYGERYSLIQVLGLTTADEDTDGEGEAAPGEPITPEQEATLEALLREVNANRVRWLEWMGVEKVAAIPASRYAEAVSSLEQKRRA